MKIFKIYAVLLSFLLTVPTVVLGNPLELFPDPDSFEGIKTVLVAPVSFQNMESVKLSSESVGFSIQEKLKKAGVTLRTRKNKSSGSRASGSVPEDFGVLSATVRGSTSSGSLVAPIHAFTISLRFLQTARVQPSDHHGWVITWVETRSVIGGTKRPKHITEALEGLVHSFIQDFTQ